MHGGVQPGVASVYCSIVQQTRTGAEFYIQPFPELVGQSYQEIRRSFSRAVACGFQRADKSLAINPPDDAVLQEGDSVIGLAQSGVCMGPGSRAWELQVPAAASASQASR